jgi:thiol-disulfide isomerase/thioredoxin
MKNILIFILIIFSFNSIAISKETTFTNQIFEKSQLDGKTVVINSWNKTCVTCARQVKILDQAKKRF